MVMVLDLRLLRISFRGQPVSLIMQQLMPWSKLVLAGINDLLWFGVAWSGRAIAFFQ